jgi:NAD(P)-dependent dehydrogenase (short-subunit alcohol dehydrogenase family)
MRDVCGKVAFVTGGVSGIGLGIARAFVAAGMKVVITGRESRCIDAALASLRSGDNTGVHAMELDVTDRAAVAEAAAEVERVFGKIHVLCNNAGVNVLGPVDEATYDDWDWMLEVNLTGVINVLVPFLPRIKAHGEGGHVVNVASMASFVTGPSSGIYATSKFAVRGLTESLRYNLAPHRIGVSLVCPGLTRTNIYRSSLTRPARFRNTAFPIDEALLKRMEEAHALGMDPDEVGRRTLQGMLRGDFYVFSHPEFREELEEAHDEIMAAVPEPSEADPPRLRVEAGRRARKAEARAAVEALRWLAIGASP